VTCQNFLQDYSELSSELAVVFPFINFSTTTGSIVKAPRIPQQPTNIIPYLSPVASPMNAKTKNNYDFLI